MGIESNLMLTVGPTDELILEGPFNRAVCKRMLVFNPSNKTRVAFKLKSTTPHLFFVRPNVGLVQPMETVGIEIYVHPICQADLMQEHKFLMQAMEVNVDVSDLYVIWRSVSSFNIWNTKIKITLLEARVLTDSTGEAALEEEDLLQRKEPSDPLAMLLKQVNVLEEERQNLLQQVETLHKEKEDQKCFYMNQKSEERGFMNFFSYFMMIAGVVCALFGSID